jgi:hypothetical protein
MRSLLILSAVTLSVSIATADQTGSLTSKTDEMQPEVLISILPEADLARQIAAPTGAIEHKSEVSRSGPVAAVVTTKSCQKDTEGICRVNADVVVYRPDGSIHQQVKAVDLPAGRVSIALNFDAQAPSGIYRVVATIRDLAARRFGTAERKFGLK